MNRLLVAPLALVTLTASLLAANFDWPQWRGPNRDDVSKETGLLQSWPEGGPKRVWLYENAGSGYSGPAIVGGKFFTIGTRDNLEILLVLDANTGKELWTASLGSVYQNGYGNGPRGTPAIDGDKAYVMSGRGNLVCVDIADGKVVWQKGMTSLGGRVPGWGYTESVLVDGDRVLCTPGGQQGTIAALDKKTGEVLWRSTDFTDGAHYSSIVPADLNGGRQYIQRTERNVVGIAANDGKLLWKTSFPGSTAVIPTPIYRDGQVYVAAGYNAGCKSFKIGSDNQLTILYENNKEMINHHGGVILIGDYVYGHSYQGNSPGWVCQNFKTGESVWRYKGFGKGAIAYADGMFYCLDERSGNVALIDASPEGWKEHGRFKLEPQTQIRSSSGAIWTHPVISNGKLYLRDQDLISCYDVKKS